MLLLLALLVSQGIRAQYNPDNPDEPGARPWELVLNAIPAEAGYFNLNQLSGHAEGEQVNLTAYTNNGYRFLRWEDAQGNTLSTERNLRYNMPGYNIFLTARFEYSPDNPDEPGQASIKRRLNLKTNPADAGRFNLNSTNNIATGQLVHLQVYNSQNYIFRDWTENGSVISTASSFSFTMPDKDVTLTANFDFDYQPNSPNEPGQPQGEYGNIYAMRESVLAGQTYIYPIYFENNGSDVTGFSFNVIFPKDFTVNTKDITLTDRVANHSLQTEQVEADSWHFTVSGANAIESGSGKVLLIPIKVPDTATVGDVHTVELKNGMVFKSDGQQVAVNVRSGSLKIVRSADEKPDSPDYVVTDLQTTSSSVSPGELVELTWKVKNQGNLTGNGGWTERIYLVAANGRKVSIGTVSYDATELQPGSVVSRSATVSLGQMPGIDGKADLAVTIIPTTNSGEAVDYQLNNTVQTSGTPIDVKKCLYLTLPEKAHVEGNDKTIRCQLARSGDWSSSETFQLTKISGDNRVSFPETITIPREQAAAYFYLPLANNNECDEDSIASFRVEGNGYPSLTGRIVIEDDELPALKLTTSKNVVNEGETIQLTISRSQHLQEALTVTLTCEKPKRFSYPQQVTIPAGQQSVTVDVVAKDDDVPSETLSVVFAVSAPNAEKSEVIVLLEDDDMPVLELSLQPNKVQEGAGPVSVAGTLRRTTNKDSKITVKLTDDADGDLYFGNRTLVLQKGTEEVSFNFGPIDNTLVDGDRTYTVTAAVWLSSCSCSAAGETAGSVSAQLQVLDDDGPALTLSSTMSTIKEGGKATLTVSRNTTASLDQPLTIYLSSDYDENLSYEHTVTIPVGQQTAQMEITSTKNDVNGDTHTAVFTVQADGFASGTCWLMVTDQTLPDAVITAISVAEQVVEAGGKATVSVTVKNGGAAVLPAQTKVSLYMEKYPDFSKVLFTQESLSPGESTTITRSISIPKTTGEYQIYVVVNENKEVAEQFYNNNTSQFASIVLLSPYNVTVTADKTAYSPGETITLSGKTDGSNNSAAEVELYFINGGLRQTIVAKTDGEGAFSASFTPHERQIGHFSFGACYPGENTFEEMGSFDVLGIRRTSTDFITCDVTLRNTYNGEIELENPSSIALTNVTANISSLPDNCELQFSSIAKIEGGQKARLLFTLTGNALTEGDDWQEITIDIGTSQGASLRMPLFFYCRHEEAFLEADIEEINTTMSQGLVQEYSFNVTNMGHGETGILSLGLPSWMKASTPLRMPSIGQGESAQIVLLLAPNDDMSFNVPVTGHIAVNCEYGDGLSLPFSIEPVTEKTGQFIADVCDVFTFQPVESGEAPHVKGAHAFVKHPVTGTVVAEAITSENGLFKAELPGGLYELEVISDKHEPFSTYISIAAGRTTHKQVILSYQAITTKWGVVETEVEDEYDITVTTEYETNVPIPIVIIEGPTKVNVADMAPGESELLYFTLTNKGLINAEDVVFEVPESNDEWILEALAYLEPFTLAPQSSVIIPVMLTRPIISGSRKAVGNDDVNDIPDILYTRCMANLGARYKYLCNEDLIENRAAHKLAMTLCGLAQLLDAAFGGGGSGNKGKPEKPNKKPKVVEEDSRYKWVGKEETICDHDVAQRHLYALQWGIGVLTGLPGIVASAVLTAMDVAEDIALDGKIPWKTIAGFVIKPLSKIALADYEASMEIAQKPLPCVYNVIKGISDWGEYIIEHPVVKDIDWINVFDREVALMVEQYHAYDGLLKEIFGNELWYNYEDETIIPFWKYIEANGQTNQNIESLLPLKPDCASETDVESLVNHLNRDVQAARIVRRDIDYDAVKRYVSIIRNFDYMAQKDGYKNLSDRFFQAYNEYINRLNEESSSVCASVTIQVKQVMAFNRPAYRGTLTVFNGHDDTAMTDVRLDLVVKDEYGQIATSHEFQMNAESLDGFGGEISLDAGWTLNAQQTGTATVLFIPTKFAAPAEPKKYSFGGTLSYVDPYTGLEKSISLLPVQLTVNPLPDLELTYLMQRDVYGDDPLTEDVVEPKESAEFALIINNKGYGEAKNVRMLTEQPRIIENEKGLLVDFQLVSSQVNGAPASLSFGQTIANDFGTIAPHSQSYAQWWLQSSLLGHFTSYEVAATHVTDYGNVHLSLIDTVTIHEMIHGFTPLTSPKRGFLVNDIVDADDLPDVVYFTDATQQPLYMAAGSISRLSNSEFMLTTTTKQSGWNYGSVADPTGGRLRLAQITRSSDGTILPLDNMWQTNRTLRDARDWLNENRLHFVAFLPEGGESYLLTFKTQEEVGIKEVANTPDGLRVRLSPLPMGDWLYVNGNFGKIQQVEVYDMRGVKRLHKTGMLYGQGIFTGGLTAGLYYVTVSTDKGVFRTKVLKR